VILKNLTRTNKDGSGKLLRYIFRYITSKDEKVQPSKNVSRRFSFGRPFYLPSHLPKGIWLNRNDVRYLKMEQFDSDLHKDLLKKVPDSNVQEYVRKYILPEMVANNQAKENENRPFIFKHNVRGDDMQGWISQFQKVEEGRLRKRKDQPVIHHTIISFSNKDKEQITDDKIRIILKEYVRLRGENNLYIGTIHKDREHIHAHIAMSSTNILGLSSSVRKKEFEAVKVNLQQFQLRKFPEMVFSAPDHGRAKIKRNERRLVGKEVRCPETQDIINKKEEADLVDVQKLGQAQSRLKDLVQLEKLEMSSISGKLEMIDYGGENKKQEISGQERNALEDLQALRDEGFERDDSEERDYEQEIDEDKERDEDIDTDEDEQDENTTEIDEEDE